MRIVIILLVVLITSSCTKHDQFEIITDPAIDKIKLTETITGRVIATNLENPGTFNIDYVTLGSIGIDGGNAECLTILRPGKKVKIQFKEPSLLISTDLADSLLSFLASSNNEFIGKNQSAIFGSADPAEVLILFDNFIEHRDSILDTFSSELAVIDLEFLHYQNEARIFSFLFYYGRLIKNLSASHEFFNFINKIDPEANFAKSLPHNVLYKFEIQYLRESNLLNNMSEFLLFNSRNTNSADLQSYYEAVYISEIIGSPSYWAKHQELFNSEIVNSILDSQNNNPYYYIIETYSNQYLSSLSGKKAYIFSAQNCLDSAINLSDYKNKLVVIDVWASWCAPCIRHRPRMIEILEKYKSNENIQILFLSLDSSKEKWKRFLNSKSILYLDNDINIKGGLESEFTKKYNVGSIPKYIVVNSSGDIVTANAPEPSDALEKLINEELSKM